MGARRNFHKGWKAQKKAPHMEKNVAKGPSHGEKCSEKALHKEKNVEKKAPTWRQSSKKVSHIANKNVFGFSGGRAPTPAPPPCGRPYMLYITCSLRSLGSRQLYLLVTLLSTVGSPIQLNYLQHAFANYTWHGIGDIGLHVDVDVL